MVEIAVLKKAFGGLVAIEEVKQAIAEVTDIKKLSDLRKRIEAARKYDSQTADRRNYWGELAIWSERRVGELIRESDIKPGRPRDNCFVEKQLLLSELLGTETESQARNISHNSQRLVDFEPAAIEQAILNLKAADEEVTKAAVKRALVGAHVGHNSGENEWYTPTEFIEAARRTMSTIDLDPASSAAANEVVKATRFFSTDDSGLAKKWKGNIWLNPPYSQPSIAEFSEKLVAEFRALSITSAIALVNNATETRWFHLIAACASAFCFPLGRVNFWSPGKVSAPLQGQAVLYLGSDSKTFLREFAQFGLCLRK